MTKVETPRQQESIRSPALFISANVRVQQLWFVARSSFLNFD